ncbi:hypothetical protein [Nitrosomonas sp. ANs5]|uniref:hypothetical protein n=1 Tax=Nitrosomonas sp. ANs5 TaxID=3423941 RepID=UPI00396EBB6E
MKPSHPYAARLVIAAALLCPALAYADFNGKTFTVTSPTWDPSGPAGAAELGVTDSRVVTASNTISPDVTDFRTAGGGFADAWNIHFDGNTVTFEFTPIYIRDLGDQVDYMYMMPTGFRIQNTHGQLAPIVGISIDDQFAPFGFEKRASQFDENNIWINLDGSMCHFYGMGSMPACTNAASPTGYDNIIKLTVHFAGEQEETLNKTRVDRLFDWAEGYYASLFPFSVKSFEVFGYYARCYGNEFCIGAKDGHVFATGGPWGEGIVDLGRLEVFYDYAGI